MEKWLYEINGKTEHIYDALNSDESIEYTTDTLNNFLEFFDLIEKSERKKNEEILDLFLGTNKNFNPKELTSVIPILLLIRSDLLIAKQKEVLIHIIKIQKEGHDSLVKIFEMQKKYSWSFYKTITVLISCNENTLKNFLSEINFFDYKKGDYIDNVSSWLASQFEYLETEVKYCDKCTICGSFYPVYRISAQNTSLCPYCRNKRINETYMERTKNEPVADAYHRLYHSFYNYVRTGTIEKTDFQNAMSEIKKIRDRYLESNNKDDIVFKKEASILFFNLFPSLKNL